MGKREPKTPPPPHTGWPSGLLQDDCRALSRWLANRPGARRALAESQPPARLVPDSDPYQGQGASEEPRGAPEAIGHFIGMCGRFKVYIVAPRGREGAEGKG